MCFRPWRAHLDILYCFQQYLSEALRWCWLLWRIQESDVVVQIWRVDVCVWMNVCVYVSGKVSVLTAKSSLHQGFLHCVFVVCVLKQPAERGRGWGLEHLHTVAQAFCLYTRLLPSNASRPSRLWPPRGSKGALPLKSQLCLILSARQIFHSPAVHLRSMVHNPLTSFYTAGESLCRFKRALSITPVSSLLLLPKQQSCPLTLCSELYGLGFSDICNIKLTQSHLAHFFLIRYKM